MQGALLAERYHVTELLGAGGAGRVYRATDLRTGGPVAVKMLHPLLARDATARERLRREAQLAAQLASPRIVRVLDLAEQDGVPYVVMEYVAGQTLQQRLHSGGPLAPDEALFVAREVALALGAAHAAGVVHRDLKPQNIMLVDGQVKVLDFGIARAKALVGLTMADAFVGTPEYSAPEQANGHSDSRSDIYALGVVLFAMVTGRTPFQGPTALAVLRQHETTPPALPQTLPESVREVIARCLAKRPDDRFQTAEALVSALEQARGAIGGRPLDSPAGMRTPAGATPAGMTGGTPTPAGGRPPALPVPLSSFVGREREVDEVRQLLTESRLLTLTGAGGAGKTRLALHVAAQAVGTRSAGESGTMEFPDGAFLTSLAPVAEASLVPRAVATALGVRETLGRPLSDVLVEFLRSRRLLLVLDNCEHLVPACAALAGILLRACPQLHILATSRSALGVEGELLWTVPPLAVPELPEREPGDTALPPLPPLSQVEAYEAVRLFVDRAAAARPGFALTAANARAVVQICARLDGLPLAIELAAARVRVLSAEQIAARLDDRFRLLGAGSRTALPHQRTLRAAMDWSHDLLTPVEQALFRRLAVFAGGLTLEAAEDVVVAGTLAPDADDPLQEEDLLDILAALVDKSLVQRRDDAQGDPRFDMLQTVREYAIVRLAESGEADALRSRHLTHFLRLAKDAERALRSREQLVWLDRLEGERENIRAALDWSVAAPDEAPRGLALAVAMGWFWYLRGFRSEGRARLEALLANVPLPAGEHGGTTGEIAFARARGLSIAGHLAHYSGDQAAAMRLVGESYTAARATGNPVAIGWALVNRQVVTPRVAGDAASQVPDWQEALTCFASANEPWGVALARSWLGALALEQDDLAGAADHLQASIDQFRRLGDRWGIALDLARLADLDERRGDTAAAEAHFREQQALARALGHRGAMAGGQSRLAALAIRRGDTAAAAAHYERSISLYRAIGERRSVAAPLDALARLLAREQGDFTRAESLLAESLAIRLEYRDRAGLANGLLSCAEVAIHRGLPERAARLLGAVEAALAAGATDAGGDALADVRSPLEREVAALDQTLGHQDAPAGWSSARRAGQALTLEQAAAVAVGPAPPQPPATPAV